MKHILTILTLLLLLSSCQNNNNKTTKDKSLSGRAATALCNCQAVKDFINLKAEIAAASEEEKKEMIGKIIVLSQEMKSCLKDINKEAEKLKEDEKELFQKQLEAKMMKSCPDLAKKLFEDK
jgi:hypothetical protein